MRESSKLAKEIKRTVRLFDHCGLSSLKEGAWRKEEKALKSPFS